MAENALQVHVEVQAHLEAANAKYKAKVDNRQHIKVF